MSVGNLVGQKLAQYELRELLGVGGMGAVYRAYQTNLKREVAVKTLSEGLAAEPDYVARFNREAEVSASLEHAHIVPVHDYGIQGNIAYVVMRLLTGGSLAERLQQTRDENRPQPSLGETADLLRQLASALDYAHSRGVIHRDIKPANIMFDNQGSAYLVDFGIAKLLGGSTGITGLTGAQTVGTPSYMPPEQWRSSTLTPAADQYALAIVVYAMLTGRVPFEADTPFQLMHKHEHEEPTPLHKHRSGLPQAVEAALMRAMSKEPEKRFPTVTAFSQAFDSAITGAAAAEKTGFFSTNVNKPSGTGSLSQRTASMVMPSPPRKGRSPLVWVGALAALVIFAGLALLALLSLGELDGAALITIEDNFTQTAADVGVIFNASETPASESSELPLDAPAATAEVQGNVTAAQIVGNAATETLVTSDTPRPSATFNATDTPQPTQTPTNRPSATSAPAATSVPTSAVPELHVSTSGAVLRTAPTFGAESAVRSIYNVTLPIVGITQNREFYQVEYEGARYWIQQDVFSSVVGNLGSVQVISATVSQPTVPASQPTTAVSQPTVTLAATVVNAQVFIEDVLGAGNITSETVVILNTGNTVNLNGWTLTDSDGSTYTFDDQALTADARIAVYSRAGQNTAAARFWGQQAAVWQAGDVVTLTDDNGAIQSIFRIP